MRRPTRPRPFGNRSKPPSSQPKKASVPAVPRKISFEDLLCRAIGQGVTVRLRYHKPDELPDGLHRTFGPTAVYWSEVMKVCVSGEELDNPNEPGKPPSPHNFEVGRIVDLEITTDGFQPSAAVDYSQAKYRNGVLCRR